jgi:hypothetical protein
MNTAAVEERFDDLANLARQFVALCGAWRIYI